MADLYQTLADCPRRFHSLSGSPDCFFDGTGELSHKGGSEIFSDRILLAGFFYSQLIAGAYGILLIPLLSPFTSGMEFFYIEAARGRVKFQNVFAGFTRSWLSVILFALVLTVFIWIGFLFLIIPGIYLSVCYIYADNLIVDQKMGFWEAMELSRKTVHQNWFSVFGLLLLLLILLISGFFLCCIGVVFTFILTYFIGFVRNGSLEIG